MNPPPNTPWMTREEAAEFLRISPRTLDNMARRGEVTRFHLRSSPRYRRSEIAALVEIDDHVGERMTPNLAKANEARNAKRDGKA